MELDNDYYEKLYNYIKKENQKLYEWLTLELGTDRAYFITQMVNSSMMATDEYEALPDTLKPKK
jgi:hypothetical protein